MVSLSLNAVQQGARGTRVQTCARFMMKKTKMDIPNPIYTVLFAAVLPARQDFRLLLPKETVHTRAKHMYRNIR